MNSVQDVFSKVQVEPTDKVWFLCFHLVSSNIEKVSVLVHQLYVRPSTVSRSSESFEFSDDSDSDNEEYTHGAEESMSSESEEMSRGVRRSHCKSLITMVNISE